MFRASEGCVSCVADGGVRVDLGSDSWGVLQTAHRLVMNLIDIDELLARWRHRHSVGCRVKGVGCRVQGAGCRVQGAGCRVVGVGCRVQGVGCRLQGVGCGVQGAGCRV